MFENGHIGTPFFRMVGKRAPSIPSREPEGLGRALWDQPEDRRQMEEADLGGRSADRSERTEVDGPLD